MSMWREGMQRLAGAVRSSRRTVLATQAPMHAQQTRSLITIKKSPILTKKPAAYPKKQPKPAAPAVATDGDAAADGDEQQPPSDRKTARLAKRIAMSGLCSRREAEKYIESHDVMVNGEVVSDMATVVDVKRDVVTVAGRALSSVEKLKVWMAHKLPGVRIYAFAMSSYCYWFILTELVVYLFDVYGTGTRDDQRSAGPPDDLRPPQGHGTHPAHHARRTHPLTATLSNAIGHIPYSHA